MISIALHIAQVGVHSRIDKQGRGAAQSKQARQVWNPTAPRDVSINPLQPTDLPDKARSGGSIPHNGWDCHSNEDGQAKNQTRLLCRMEVPSLPVSAKIQWLPWSQCLHCSGLCPITAGANDHASWYHSPHCKGHVSVTGDIEKLCC